MVLKDMLSLCEISESSVFFKHIFTMTLQTYSTMTEYVAYTFTY